MTVLFANLGEKRVNVAPQGVKRGPSRAHLKGMPCQESKMTLYIDTCKKTLLVVDPLRLKLMIRITESFPHYILHTSK